jgi:ABC-type branched-subunit amino acid transport system substrate-binding protein
MKAQLRREAAGLGLFGPYAGPEDMLAKLMALQNYGIPGISQDIDDILAGGTMQELRQLVAEINKQKNTAALVAGQAQVDQLMLASAAQEQEAQGLMGGGQAQQAQPPQMGGMPQ